MPLPKIVIVGRPNVGKSSIFNMLAGRRVSIVDATAGVTRDRISTVIALPDPTGGNDEHHIEMIDTGGHGVEDVDDLTIDIEQQIAHGIAAADLVLFVTDAQTGIVTLDENVAQLLRSGGADQVMIVANKVDDESFEAGAQEAASLGFGVPVCVSATTKRNKNRLFEAIGSRIDFDKFDGEESDDDETDPGMLLAIVGKRNAGKSTLVNALAGEQRVIVSEVEGTTRDSIDVRFEIEGKHFTAIDTAGVRKRKSIKGDIDYYSHHRALRSVRRADVCLLLIDSTVPISQVDKQLAGEILKHHKPVVVVVNKWDLAEENHTVDEYAEYLDGVLMGLSFAPIALLSALNSEGITDAIGMALNLYQQAGHRVPTGELNQVIEKIMAENTPTSKVGKHPKVFYVTQTDVYPPTITFFVNDPDMFDNTYQRFLLNRFRDELPFSEVPIKLNFRPRKRIPPELRGKMND